MRKKKALDATVVHFMGEVVSVLKKKIKITNTEPKIRTDKCMVEEFKNCTFRGDVMRIASLNAPDFDFISGCIQKMWSSLSDYLFSLCHYIFFPAHDEKNWLRGFSTNVPAVMDVALSLRVLRSSVVMLYNRVFVCCNGMKALVGAIFVEMSDFSSHHKICEILTRFRSACRNMAPDVFSEDATKICCYSWWNVECKKYYIGSIVRSCVTRWKEHQRNVIVQVGENHSLPGCKFIMKTNLANGIFSVINYFCASIPRVKLLQFKNSLISWSGAGLNWPFVQNICGNVVVNFEEGTRTTSSLRRARLRSTNKWCSRARSGSPLWTDAVVTKNNEEFGKENLWTLAWRFCDWRSTKWKICCRVKWLMKSWPSSLGVLIKKMQTYPKEQHILAFRRINSVAPLWLGTRIMQIRMPFCGGLSIRNMLQSCYGSQIGACLKKNKDIMLNVMKAKTKSIKDLMCTNKTYAEKVSSEVFSCTCKQLCQVLGVTKKA